MKVAIDARWIFAEISGIGAYTRELIRNTVLIDKTNSYLLLFNDPHIMQRTAEQTGAADAENFQLLLLPYGVFSPINQLRLPQLLKTQDVDIYHSTNYMIPLLAFPGNRRSHPACVTTIHDVTPMAFPKHAPRSRKSRIFPIYKWLMQQIGKRSDIIITDSNASSTDIVAHLHIPPNRQNKIRTIYCGVSPAFTKPPPPSSPDNTSPARTILYVGRSDPYKNLSTLISAFAQLQKTAPFPVSLVIAGSKDQRYPQAEQTAKDLGIANLVSWTGYISDTQLIEQYHNADILVQPSLCEGFGLQVLEAMACGTPVICSNCSSLPEVAGRAAIQVSPHDTDAFTTAMQQILTDPQLAQSMTEKGLKQAAKFTWHKTTMQTINIYKELAG